jgi:hypothetical protein
MDIYASAALTGLGYAFSKQRDSLKQNEKPNTVSNPRETPSMKNMYSSSAYTDSRIDELKRGSHMWNNSQNPMESGIVPRPAYADQFADPNFTNDISNIDSVRTLSGEVMNVDEFKHNNMQHYFRGKITQNTLTEGFTGTGGQEQRLHNFTGRSDNIQRKTEVPCFFEPTEAFSHVCGMPDTSDVFRDRAVIGRNRNNDFPIEQVRVGKGLGLGFTADAAGGFQQGSTLDYVRPKNVDELRVATKPKLTYELPPQGPAGSSISKRQNQPILSKNRPETFYEQTPDMLLHTTGAFTKPTGRPVQDLKATSRVDSHVEYEGNAHNKNSKPGQGVKDSYGKEGILTFKNNRQVTGERTVLNNLTSTVKSIIAPLLDIFRHTTKEYLNDAARPNGNLQAQIPSKPTTYDPINHIMRTTIKETTLQDTSVSNGNLQAQIPSKPTTYDPVNHIMRTTIKETTIHDTAITNIKGNNKLTLSNEDDAKTTVRETTQTEDTTRNISSHKYKVTVYNTESIAKTTIRENTSETGSMYGFMSGDVNKSTGAYNITDINLKNTEKQYISNYEYEGIAGSKSDFRAKSEEAERNAMIDPTRDILNVSAAQTPNGAGDFSGLAPENFQQESKRLVNDDFSARDTPNLNKVWQATAQDIPLCAITKPNELLNANEGRLDPSLLQALLSNPYNLQVNPITK